MFVRRRSLISSSFRFSSSPIGAVKGLISSFISLRILSSLFSARSCSGVIISFPEKNNRSSIGCRGPSHGFSLTIAAGIDKFNGRMTRRDDTIVEASSLELSILSLASPSLRYWSKFWNLWTPNLLFSSSRIRSPVLSKYTSFNFWSRLRSLRCWIALA